MSVATRLELPSAEGLVERPLWIEGSASIFAVHHPPSESADVARQARAVLFCAPFGWQDMAGYMGRRIWAQRLAAAGHPVLRFDLPGTGHSAGRPGDDDLVPRWLDAIAVTARWLRATTDATGVTIVGTGLGALLALHASTDERTCVDELVLWDLPASSRGMLREMRVFGAGVRLITRSAKTAADAPSKPSSLPAGWIDSSGFTLSASTVAALEALSTELVPSARIGRVMLLERDAAQPSQRARAFADRLRAHGIETDVEPGIGFGAMQASPHLSVVPDETIETITTWLGRGASEESVSEQLVRPADAVAGVAVAAGVRESAIAIEQPSGTLFGVLAEPDDDAGDLCIVCLPAMAQRCIGPSRLWVDLARREAARGVPVLRIDLASVGESSGPPDAPRDVMAFAHDPDRIVQVGRVLDALERRLGPRRFILTGLSSAGYLAEAVGEIDERVAGVLSLNPLDPPDTEVGLSLLATSVRGGLWRRLVSGDFDAGFWVRWAGRWLAARIRNGARALHRATTRAEAAPAPHTYDSLLDALAERGALLTVGVAENEGAAWYFKHSSHASHPVHGAALRAHYFESSDHELRPLDDQRQTLELADDLVDRLRRD